MPEKEAVMSRSRARQRANRKRHRESLRRDSYYGAVNGSGYYDSTAWAAINNVLREQRRYANKT